MSGRSTYVVYKGDDVLCVGTARECAEALGVKVKTVCSYATPSWKRRVDGLESGRRGGFVVAERVIA